MILTASELEVVQRTFPAVELLFSQTMITEHIRRVAMAIVMDSFGRKSTRPLKLIVVLDGAMPYAMELGGELARLGMSDLSIDTIQLSRYGDDTEPTTSPILLKDLRYSITNEDVIVVEDILDAGLTLAYLRDQILLPRQPASLKIAPLLVREGAQRTGTPNGDYPMLSFADDGRFAIGYGLDMKRGRGRHYRSIYLVPKPD